jgi:transposase InsO family protein
VSRSGYYAWAQRADSPRTQANLHLLDHIKIIHDRSDGIYGSPRVHQALTKAGIVAGKHRVARLMRDAGLNGRVMRVYRRAPGIHQHYEKHQNLKLDLGAPTAINQQWGADLTYIKVARQWRYLAVVIDLHSRRVIGWSLGPQKSTELTIKALQYAVRLRAPQPGLIFHTDRGSEYAAHVMQHELARHGIRASMNRPGRCTDNAHVESFFHSLKGEALQGCTFSTEDELRRKLKHYIDYFYNYQRLHSGLGYRSPVLFEQLAN